MFIFLSISIAVFAVLTIWAKGSSRTGLEYVFKTLTMLLIISIAFFGNLNAAGNYKILIFGGLFFSLVGDVLLVDNRRFVFGLASFFVAHLFYIAALAGNFSNLNPFLVFPFLIYALILLRVLWSNLGKLKIPVVGYALVIAAMGFFAGCNYLQIQTFSTFYAMLGALFFMTSDSILAFDKFKTPIRFRDFAVLSTYFFAQWLIALSV